jgi:hypothetical protein
VIEQDPRITEGPTFFASLYAWMKRAATEINAKAPLNSPVLVTPTATTPPVPDNSTKVATTAWVHAAMASIATAAGFVFSFGASGYVKLPSWLGGFIVQWGGFTASGAGFATWTFPLAFPNSPRFVGGTCNVNVPTGNLTILVDAAGWSTTGASVAVVNAGAFVAFGTVMFAVGN